MNSNRRGGGFRKNKNAGQDFRSVTVQHFGPKKTGGQFKRRAQKKSGFYTQRNDSYAAKVFVDEDDVMEDKDGAGPSGQQRYPPNRGRYRVRGNARGRGGKPGVIDQDRARKLGLPVGGSSERSSSGWYKVMFHYESAAAVFYVNDQNQANALRSLSRQITNPGGFKLSIIVNGSSEPSVQLTDENKKFLEACMGKRFNAESKMLSLSNLYQDEDLRAQGMHLALNKFNIATAVLDVIKTNIPTLEILDLSKNRLYSLKSLRDLSNAAPNLNRINLGDNQLKLATDLDDIKKLQLIELHLDGNPLCDKFTDSSEYISMVRKRFPRLKMLDGNELPPAISFDVDAPSTLPPIQGSYFANDTVKDLTCRFLDQYFQLYDSKRQGLLDAYHEQAIFSMHFVFNKLIVGTQHTFKDYLMDSRNLVRVPDQTRRQKMLKVGRLSVVAHLDSLPATQHDPASYVVDVNHLSDAMLSFTVSGLFKEPDSKQGQVPIRSFARTFLTIPQGSGIVIVNEQYVITNALPDQCKKAFKTPAPTPSSSPVTTVGPPAPDMQQEMIKQFSVDSKMNLEWSAKCLEQNGWDYEKAGKAFLDSQSKGLVPAEAFTIPS